MNRYDLWEKNYNQKFEYLKNKKLVFMLGIGQQSLLPKGHRRVQRSDSKRGNFFKICLYTFSKDTILNLLFNVIFYSWCCSLC